MNKEIYYNYFEEKIKPLIYTYEDKRKKLAKHVVLSSIFMFLCGIFSAYLFIIISFKSSIFLLLLPVVMFLMYVFFIKSIVNVMLKGREYQNSLIQEIMPYFLAPIANFKFWPKNRDTKSIIESDLFPNFESREDEIALFGIYKDINIIISNTKLSVPVNRNVFEGVILQLELNKSIDNQVIMLSKNENVYNRYKQINPQITEMNNYLYTFAKNNNTEFITEKFWTAIKRIGEVYAAKGFGLSYNNKTVLIAIRQKRPFKFGFLFKSLLIPKNFDDLIDMFTVIFDFADLLQ